MQRSEARACCGCCGTLNLVVVKRSQQSSWNDRMAYGCSTCGMRLGMATAFHIETGRAYAPSPGGGTFLP